jgi:hypothetical protein
VSHKRSSRGTTDTTIRVRIPIRIAEVQVIVIDVNIERVAIGVQKFIIILITTRDRVLLPRMGLYTFTLE